MVIQSQALAYASPSYDRVRDRFEQAWLRRLLEELLGSGGALLDLGCGDGLAQRLAGGLARRYVGVDLVPPPGECFVEADLREGLGPIGPTPFEVYLASFGVASHLPVAALEELLAEIVAHARPGALVALEALGLRSLEWPRLWDTAPGDERSISYRLGADVRVHPWAPEELAGRYEAAGITPIYARDRSLQAGPKVGEGRYWPGLPKLRSALDALLGGDDGDAVRAELAAPLPPLPAGATARFHQRLAQCRRRLVSVPGLEATDLARAIWALEPATAGGLGHGVVVVGRVR